MNSAAGRVLAAVLAALALTLVVVGTAVRGPLPGSTGSDEPPQVARPAETSQAYQEPPMEGIFEPLGLTGGSDWSALDLTWLGLLVAILAIIGTTGLIVQPARRFKRITAAPVPEPVETTVDVDDDAESRVPALLRGIEAARASLAAHAIPSDAVVAAWLQLEDAAAESGLIRKPAQTPAEFTATVLGSTHADERATRELLELYHRARFSTHPVGAAEVALAADCLGRIAASWPVPSETSAS